MCVFGSFRFSGVVVCKVGDEKAKRTHSKSVPVFVVKISVQKRPKPGKNSGKSENSAHCVDCDSRSGGN